MKKIIGYLFVACIMCWGCNEVNDVKSDGPIKIGQGEWSLSLSEGAGRCMRKIADKDGMHPAQRMEMNIAWCEQTSSTSAKCQVYASYERPYGEWKAFRGILWMGWEDGMKLTCDDTLIL